jgi:large subunit ribosomal protein L25
MIEVVTRPKTSSLAVNRLRKEGILPMALIEKGNGTRLIQAPVAHVKAVLSGKDGLKIFPLTLDSGSREMRVVVKEIRRHEVTHKVTTMVLQEVVDEDKIRIAVPVTYSGTPKAVAKNVASLITPVSTLLVQAKVKDLPDSVQIDCSKMKQNDRILVQDLNLPEGVNALSSPETVVASTVQLRGMADFVEEEEEAPAE